MKKSLIATLTILLLVAGSAFAGGAKESPAGTAPAATKATIQFLNIGPTTKVQNLFDQTIIPGFEKQYPNTKVDMLTSDWGSAFQKVTTGIAAGTASDVMVIGGIWVAPLAAKGGLLPLDSYVSTMPQKEDIYSAAWKDTEYQGHIYAVPWNLDVRTLAYRKDLFEAAGLNPNDPPTTWAQYLADAKKLTKFSGGQMVRAGTLVGLDTSIGVQQYFAQLFFQAGGSYYTSDGKANFDSQAGRDAIDFFKKLFVDKVTDPSFITPNNSASPLTLGTAAMDFSGIADLQNAQVYNPKIADQIGFGKPLAMNQDTQPKTVVWVNKVAIFKGTHYPKEAWEFASYITSGQNVNQWAQFVGNLPARKSVAKMQPWASEPMTQALLANMQYATVQPASPAMFQIPQIIKNLLMEVIYSKISPDAALKQMDEQIDAALAQ